MKAYYERYVYIADCVKTYEDGSRNDAYMHHVEV
jgi:hypothetical protein